MKKIAIYFLLIIFSPILLVAKNNISKEKKYDNRAYWVSVLTKISDPVLTNLAEEKLRVNMPIECKDPKRKEVAHLEAFGRTLVGIAPWLELGIDATPEGKLRKKYILLTRKAIANAVNPNSPDFLNFNKNSAQPLVDAAFMANGLLHGFNQLWLPLDSITKVNVIRALQSTRVIKAGDNNWLLFSAMVEIFMIKAGAQYNGKTIEYALKKHAEWYKGDGAYGDGPDFHWDYYNSFVIQPMILTITNTLREKSQDTIMNYKTVLKRAQRFAAVQERLISPEGTFPPIGRSLVYRFGAFQNLSQVALNKKLPNDVSPAQVRSALSAVIHRLMISPELFDKNGWIRIGFYGSQPDLAEGYITTGSLYLCTTGLVALGLPANDPFWTSPAEDWTSVKIWEGVNMSADHALK
ncbi:MAG: DUF2264 domain-containing protein [Paludibacter sp.]|nr:DUF2264 domain-containing protein [Paludibacter sp.]